MTKEKKPSCELAIDIAVQTTKLLIALASSALAFTLTFPNEINKGVINWVVKVPWCLLGLSIIAGVILLQAIIGRLHSKGEVSLFQPAIKWLSVIQNLTFLAAVLWVFIGLMVQCGR